MTWLNFLQFLLNVLQYFCLMIWLFGQDAGRTLTPWPRTKTAPSAMEGKVLTTGLPGKSPVLQLEIQLDLVRSFLWNYLMWDSGIRELWTSRCSSWFQKRQRNQRSNCEHPLDHGKSKRVPEKHIYFYFIDMPKPLTV